MMKYVNGVLMEMTPEEIAALNGATFEDRRARRRQAVRELRKAKETAGCEFGGVLIQTDSVSQSKVAGAASLFDRDPTLESIDWEAQPGVWIALDKPTVNAIGVAVGRYVQGCFTRARALDEALAAAADDAELDAIDIEAGWPS